MPSTQVVKHLVTACYQLHVGLKFIYLKKSVFTALELELQFNLSETARGSKDTPESPPVFVKLLTDLLVAEGEESLFDCVITGEPKPEIKWFLNGDEIVENDRIKVFLFY